MNFTKIVGPSALFLLLGTGANVYGQHEEQGKPEKSEGKPKQEQRAQPEQRPQQPRQQQKDHAQQPRQQPDRTRQPAQAQREQPPATQRAQTPQPAQRQQPAPQHRQSAQTTRPSPQQRSYTPPLRTQQQARTWQQQSGWRQDGAWQAHASWQLSRSSNWQTDHRTWSQRGGYGGYYIPQDSFSLHFGAGNWFRIQSQPTIVDGYPRFQYGGYSFMMVDPWPADWAQDWYASDDVYVGFDNGYYLYNRQYPGEAIAITVVF
jgi:hypothetical protein